MVRLLLISVPPERQRENGFNPTMVRLLHFTLPPLAHPYTQCFNPTMVRLLQSSKQPLT